MVSLQIQLKFIRVFYSHFLFFHIQMRPMAMSPTKKEMKVRIFSNFMFLTIVLGIYPVALVRRSKVSSLLLIQFSIFGSNMCVHSE